MAFGTPKGSSYSDAQIVLGKTIDLGASATTSITFTVPTGFRAYVDIQNAVANVTTTIAGDQTVPTVTVKKDSTEIGTFTFADTLAANETVACTPATGKESGEVVAAGETIVIAHTQAADAQSADGDALPYIPVYLERI